MVGVVAVPVPRNYAKPARGVRQCGGYLLQIKLGSDVDEGNVNELLRTLDYMPLAIF